MSSVSTYNNSIPSSTTPVKLLRRDLPDWLKQFGNYAIAFNYKTICVTKLAPLTAYVLDHHSRCNCEASAQWGKSCRHERIVAFVQKYFLCPVHNWQGSAHEQFLVVEFRGKTTLMCQCCLEGDQGWFGRSLTEQEAVLVREALASSQKYADKRAAQTGVN